MVKVAKQKLRHPASRGEQRWQDDWPLLFFPSRDNQGTKPSREWKSACWPKDTLAPNAVIQWIDFFATDFGPLDFQSALRGYNPSRYSGDSARTGLIADAFFLARGIALRVGERPPPMPSAPLDFIAIKQELLLLRKWITSLGQQPAVRDLDSLLDEALRGLGVSRATFGRVIPRNIILLYWKKCHRLGPAACRDRWLATGLPPTLSKKSDDVATQIKRAARKLGHEVSVK